MLIRLTPTRYVLASDFDGIAAELAECRNSRQREHDLRVSQEGGEEYEVDFNYLPENSQFVILTACSEAMRCERDNEADSLNDAEVANG